MEYKFWWNEAKGEMQDPEGTVWIRESDQEGFDVKEHIDKRFEDLERLIKDQHKEACSIASKVQAVRRKT